jgi:hypothetical protein
MQFKGERQNSLQHKPPAEDLETAMYNRMTGYDQRLGMAGGSNGPPPEINFSLDDETTKRHRPERQNDGNGNNMGQDLSQIFSGFEGFNGQMDSGFGGLDDIGTLGIKQSDGSMPAMGQNDATAAFNKIQNERSSMDNAISSGKRPANFNPMNSPNQQQFQQQSQQQFRQQPHQQFRQQPHQQFQQQPQQQFRQQQFQQQPQQQFQQQPHQQFQQQPHQQFRQQPHQQFQQQPQQQFQQQIPQQFRQQQFQRQFQQPQQPQGNFGMKPNEQEEFFQVTPSEREGVNIIPSPSMKTSDYVRIATDIMMTGNLSIIKGMSSIDINNILTVINSHQNNTTDSNETIVHDITVKKINQTETPTIQKDMTVTNNFTNSTLHTENTKLIRQVDTSKISDLLEKDDTEHNIVEQHNDECYEKRDSTRIESDSLVNYSGNANVVDECARNVIIINDTKYNIDEYVDSMYYNNFMITLKEPIDNIISMEIQNVDININANNITNYNNFLTIKIANDENSLTINPGNYDIDELLRYINSALNCNNIDINFTMRGDNHIVANSQYEFSMGNDKISVLRILGFVDKKYYGTNEYISDNKYCLNTNVNAYLKMIFNGVKNQTCKIDLPFDTTSNKQIDKNINSLTNIIFKIKQDNNCSYDLLGIAPKITLKFNN